MNKERIPKYKKHFHLKNRLFLSITLLIFGSVAIISLAGSLWYQKFYIDNYSDQNQDIVNQIALNTGSYIDELSRLSLAPYYSKDIMKLLDTTPSSSEDKLVKKRSIENYLREVMTIPRKEILRVYILSDDIYYTTRTSHSIAIEKDFSKLDWYKEAMLSTDILFLPAQTESEGGYTLSVFSLVRQLRSLSGDNHPLGLIRVDANFDGISDVLDPVKLRDNSALFIMDSSLNLIYNRSSLPADVKPSDLFLLSQNEDGANLVSLDSEDYIVNIKRIEGTDWSIVEATSKKELMRGASPIRIFSLILALICCGIGLFITGVFVKSFISPINETVNVMMRTRDGNLSVRAPECAPFELHFLNETYNEMLDRIEEMIDKNKRLTKKMYETKYLQKKAQYDSLYQQIQPHFIFNTLNTISLLIKSKREEDALESINELSVILRGMVNADSEIALCSELRITESYLSLQARRHEALTFEIKSSPGIDKLLIPSMTIQPIVENSIVHGCEPKCAPTHILVDATLSNAFVKITVSDNGIGMNKQDCEELNNSLFTIFDNRTESGGVGLSNIAQRLRLKYGKDFSMKITSTENVGTTTTIHIPLLFNTEDSL